MGDWLRERLGERPTWMNALLAFCAFMTFVYLPWDLFVKPIAVDEEVWFGIRFHGVLAKLLALPHWALYAAGTVGFWRMRRWMWPWAALYTAQVAVGFLVWPFLYVGGLRGAILGAVGAAAFGALAFALHAARGRFEHARPGPRERYGEWALVTGASAGIGAAFARALAADGISCVLTARREERLRELAGELESRCGVKTRVVGVDLGAPGGAEALLRAVSDLEIAILVNNAGVGGAGRFDELEPARLRQMIELNCATPVALTRALLPAMRVRGRGAVVMVGSVAGCQPLPLHGLYAATKAFDNLLGEALWAECRGTGVDCLALLPGPTETEFQAVAGELPHAGEPPEQVVATALDALGRQASVISGWFNWLRANAASRLVSRSVLALAAKSVFEQHVPEERR
jgi:short-subunit dehydrogenase